MSVRNYAILYGGVRRVSTGGSIGGGNQLLTTEQHSLDGTEHTAATGTDRLLATEAHSGLLLPLSGDPADSLRGDGTWAPTDPTETIVGEVAPDPTNTGIVANTGAHEAFPGAAWLDSPTATEHGVGDRFIVVYRSASSHLTNGNTVAKIGTVTSTAPWAWTFGSVFTIENIANDVRVDDGVSVLDIDGTGDYRAVVLCREYSGGANHTPHVHVCDDASASMTSTSTWTRHDIALSGHTQDLGLGRVHKLDNGRFMIGFLSIAGATFTVGVGWTLDITDWSSPTFVNVYSGTDLRDELDFEEVSPGVLYMNIRNDTTSFIDYSRSDDSGDTWTAPMPLFAGTYFPTWRVLNSGIGLSVHADTSGFDFAYRQTPSGITDAGWGAETIYDPDPLTSSDYATILQLDNNNILVIQSIETISGGDPTAADISWVLFTDSSIIGTSDAISGITIQDEGVVLPTLATTLNFEGAGVVASGSGPTKTITIASSGGGASASDTSLWRPLMDGAGAVITDGTGQAVMAFGPA